ncbi:unnamed protein product [Urochloa humidicola]
MGGLPAQDLATEGLGLAAVYPDPWSQGSGVSSMATSYDFVVLSTSRGWLVLVPHRSWDGAPRGGSRGDWMRDPGSSTEGLRAAEHGASSTTHGCWSTCCSHPFVQVRWSI